MLNIKSINGTIARHIIGCLVMMLAVGIVAALFLVEIPAGNAEVALVVLGVAIGWAGSVVNYHYGTSEGSKTKTRMLGEGGA